MKSLNPTNPQDREELLNEDRLVWYIPPSPDKLAAIEDQERITKERKMNEHEHAIPAEISAAISQVKSHVTRLAKNEENKYQRYNYTSVDSFYEVLGPLESAAGLSIIMTEADPPEILPMAKADREGSSAWLKIRWAITIGHTSGATYGPIYRTVMVPASGAQAFGSAESYISKQFARCLYRIPTGDKDDADANDKHPLPSGREQAKAPAKQPAKQPLNPASALLAKVSCETSWVRLAALRTAANELAGGEPVVSLANQKIISVVEAKLLAAPSVAEVEKLYAGAMKDAAFAGENEKTLLLEIAAKRKHELETVE